MKKREETRGKREANVSKNAPKRCEVGAADGTAIDGTAAAAIVVVGQRNARSCTGGCNHDTAMGSNLLEQLDPSQAS